MRKLGLLFLAFGLSVAASAQLRVDSLGRSEFGVIPEETYDDLTEDTVTAYGEEGTSVLNLYIPGLLKPALGDRDAPYFIQCVKGDHNPTGLFLDSLLGAFSRVFYVDSNGNVFAKGTTIQPAIEPDIFEIGPYPGVVQTTSPNFSRSSVQSPLSKLSGITGVSYTVGQSATGGVSMMSAGSAAAQSRQRLGL